MESTLSSVLACLRNLETGCFKNIPKQSTYFQYNALLRYLFKTILPDFANKLINIKCLLEFIKQKQTIHYIYSIFS